jgi:hypothetical protein
MRFAFIALFVSALAVYIFSSVKLALGGASLYNLIATASLVLMTISLFMTTLREGVLAALGYSLLNLVVLISGHSALVAGLAPGGVVYEGVVVFREYTLPIYTSFLAYLDSIGPRSINIDTSVLVQWAQILAAAVAIADFLFRRTSRSE